MAGELNFYKDRGFVGILFRGKFWRIRRGWTLFGRKKAESVHGGFAFLQIIP
jgi:hypothetical protein